MTAHPALGGCACSPEERDPVHDVAFFAGLLNVLAFFWLPIVVILLLTLMAT